MSRMLGTRNHRMGLLGRYIGFGLLGRVGTGYGSGLLGIIGHGFGLMGRCCGFGLLGRIGTGYGGVFL